MLSKMYLSLFALVVSFVLSMFAAKAEAANTWYVSLNRTGVQDGKSWATAWNDLANINWSVVQAGDTVLIDGGASGLMYSTPLTVPDTAWAQPVQILGTTASGHNGEITISGATMGPGGVGITVLGNNVNIAGTSPGQILIQNCTNCGVLIDGSNIQAGTQTISNLEIEFSHTVGVIVQQTTTYPANPTIIYSKIHDNGSGAVLATAPVSVELSWLYNTAYSQNYLILQQTGAALGSGGHLASCVVGPGLYAGVYLRDPSATVNNCLLIDFQYNFLVVDSTAKGELNSITNCTSYQTPLNWLGETNYCVWDQSTVQAQKVSNSIFYGGDVYINPPTRVVGQKPNDQYNVTGNTTALASSQIDPQFNDKALYTFPNNVSINTLTNADYSVSSTGPAAGEGATITSVAQLLKLMK